MRILVPVDGSPPSIRAVEHAAALLRGSGDGGIVLVNVQSPATLDVSDVTAVISLEADRKLAESRAKKALRNAVRLCRKAQVEFSTRTELGPVADTIAKLARQLPADQIVMGTRGLGAIRRLVLGSVATRVVQLVRIPVTLVK